MAIIGVATPFWDGCEKRVFKKRKSQRFKKNTNYKDRRTLTIPRLDDGTGKGHNKNLKDRINRNG